MFADNYRFRIPPELRKIRLYDWSRDKIPENFSSLKCVGIRHTQRFTEVNRKFHLFPGLQANFELHDIKICAKPRQITACDVCHHMQSYKNPDISSLGTDNQDRSISDSFLE